MKIGKYEICKHFIPANDIKSSDNDFCSWSYSAQYYDTTAQAFRGRVFPTKQQAIEWAKTQEEKS